MRKQFFQAVRGVLLALVLFELLFLLGGRISRLGKWLSTYAVVIAAVLLLLCLYRTWIRKARGGRTEYLVTMAPGAYGYIGGIFEKEKLGDLTRVPGGWFTGVRTYRAEDGSLLFTVRRPGEGKPLVRAVGAVILTAVLLGPLSVLSHVDRANAAALGWLGDSGTVPDTVMDGAPPAQPEDNISQTQPEDSPADVPQDDGTDTGLMDTVTGWFTGAKDWVSGITDFFGGDDANYILPSHKRELKNKDVEGMDVAQLQRAINEMYARHGCQIGSAEDKEYFESQDWYTPDPDMTFEQARAEFSDIEEKNFDFLVDCRNALRG
ncbi:MAG: YARHG domain-containing protein [Eubacteriales bacterium]|nr:YARHG domain-containing protein [Eubacteriales bacterium]